MSSDTWGEEQFSEESLVLSGEGVSVSELGVGGVVDHEGWYHLECTEVTPETQTTNKKGAPRTPSVAFEFCVLQSVDGQSPAGSRLWHRIYFSDKEGSRKAAFVFGLGMGVLKIMGHNVVDAQTGETRITMATWRACQGRQVIARVVHEKGTGGYEGKYAIPFGRVFGVRDPAVAHVPKNHDAIALCVADEPNQPIPQPPEDPLADL